MKVGIRVMCTVCGREKAPRGRSHPPELYLCHMMAECPGYWSDPKPGDLWPDETVLSSGRELTADRGVITLDGHGLAWTVQSDGEPFENLNTLEPPLTPAERAEIADEMIRRWQTWRDQG